MVGRLTPNQQTCVRFAVLLPEARSRLADRRNLRLPLRKSDKQEAHKMNKGGLTLYHTIMLCLLAALVGLKVYDLLRR